MFIKSIIKLFTEMSSYSAVWNKFNLLQRVLTDAGDLPVLLGEA